MGKTFNTGRLGNGLFVDANGNVGIGTTTPNDLFEVRGGFIRLSATTGNGPQFNLYSNNQTSNHITLAQGFALATDNIGYLYNRANADFVFGTNNSERLRISSGGNVGIGTTNPLTILDVRQAATGAATVNVGFRDSSTNGNALQIWNGNNEARFRAVYYGTPSDQNITFYTITSAGAEGERMRITASGEVAIGTTSTSNEGNLFLGAKNTVEGGQLVLQKGTSQTYAAHIDNYANQLRFMTGTDTASSSAKMIIDLSNGNVGIGTGSPSSFADGGLTLGTSSVGKSLLLYSSSDGNNGLIQMIDKNGNNAFQIYGHSSALGFYGYGSRDMQFYTNGAERIRVTSRGMLKFGNLPLDNIAIDSSNAVSIANGGTISFETFSGLVIVNNMSNGQCAMWLCGAGYTSLVGSSYGAAAGTMSYSGAINGYVWTSNYGATANYGIFAVRTRQNA